MANAVQIINLAGALIGTETRVTDPDDDRVLPRKAKAVWDVQRRATIRDGEWNFACERAGLPALVGPVPHPFAWAYEMPAKALRLLELIDGSRDDYRLEKRKILSNRGAPLNVRYLIDVEDPANWDEAFADCFAARIAWTIGRSIAGSAYDVDAGERTYRRKLIDAKSVDARENPPLEQEECGWVNARMGYSG